MDRYSELHDRRAYDAAEVDGLIAGLRADLARAQRDLASAEARARRAETTLAGRGQDAALVGRALLLIQAAVGDALGERGMAPLKPSPAASIVPVPPPDDFFVALRKSLDDGAPLGPRDDEQPLTARLSSIEPTWAGCERWAKVRIDAD